MGLGRCFWKAALPEIRPRRRPIRQEKVMSIESLGCGKVGLVQGEHHRRFHRRLLTSREVRFGLPWQGID
jgi:hypothetical protein